MAFQNALYKKVLASYVSKIEAYFASEPDLQEQALELVNLYLNKDETAIIKSTLTISSTVEVCEIFEAHLAPELEEVIIEPLLELYSRKVKQAQVSKDQDGQDAFSLFQNFIDKCHVLEQEILDGPQHNPPKPELWWPYWAIAKKKNPPYYWTGAKVAVALEKSPFPQEISERRTVCITPHATAVSALLAFFAKNHNGALYWFNKYIFYGNAVEAVIREHQENRQADEKSVLLAAVRSAKAFLIEERDNMISEIISPLLNLNDTGRR